MCGLYVEHLVTMFHSVMASIESHVKQKFCYIIVTNISYKYSGADTVWDPFEERNF